MPEKLLVLRVGIFIACALAIQTPLISKESFAFPTNFTKRNSITIGSSTFATKLPHNSPEAIIKELLDTNTLRLIAMAKELSEKDLESVQLARFGDTKETEFIDISLCQIGNSGKAFELLNPILRQYVEGREEGHTREYIISAITNQPVNPSVPDRDLRAIMSKRKLIAASWLKKTDAGAITNKAGEITSTQTTITIVNGKLQTNEIVNIPKTIEVCHWVQYTIVDGEIAWCYVVLHKADGSVNRVDQEKYDAKEFDPKFKETMEDVKDEVDVKMKHQGSYHQFGSVHQFWELKKQLLKERGIEWRSPQELNPNIRWD
jgi:hypothetical protein